MGVPPASGLDQALVARMAGGDRDALEQLYQRHAGWLTVRLQRRCQERELVDTALQDTFLAAWRGARRYAGTGEVGAWLWGIAVRKLIDQLRKRRPTPVENAGEQIPAPSAEDGLLEGGAYGDLGDAFRRIAPDLQTVLLATAVDGLTTREAAKLLGIPQGTVKTRLMRARDQLRGELTDLNP
jgi:RNA polymerase sigma-70 factor (ECF subfamily)